MKKEGKRSRGWKKNPRAEQEAGATSERGDEDFLPISSPQSVSSDSAFYRPKNWKKPGSASRYLFVLTLFDFRRGGLERGSMERLHRYPRFTVGL